MDSIGDRMRTIRDGLGLSQGDMAERLGIAKSSYVRYELNQRQPRSELIERISRIGEVSANWLLFGVRESRSDSTAESKHRAALVDLPRLDVMLSAGPGAVVHGEEVVDQVALPARYLRDVLRVDPDQASIVVVSGDSMYDTLSEGDLVIVDHSIKEFRQDAVYVLRVDDCLLVKRLRKRLDGTLVVASDNPRYPEELIAPGRLDQVAIVGRVAGRLGRLNGSRIP